MATLASDTQSGSSAERRRNPRIAARGSVVLRGPDHVTRGRLLNISLDAIEVAIEVACELAFEPGGLVGFDVGLRFDGVSGTWLHCPGRITQVRTTSSTRRAKFGSIVVVWEPLPVELRVVIARLEGRRLASDEVICVMIVDSDLPRRRSVATAFCSKGCVVVEVSSPLEALDWLGNGHPDPALVLVGSTGPACNADELEEYLSFAHPETITVRRLDGISDRWIAETMQLVARQLSRASST